MTVLGEIYKTEKSPVIRNFAPPKFRKVKPPTKNTINKECKCGKNREAFINFVVETKK